MLEHLKATKEKYDSIAAQLCDGAILADPKKIRDLTKEQKKLEPIVLEYERWLKFKAQMEDSEALFNEPDVDLRALAQEEYYAAKNALKESEEKLKMLLVPKNEEDDRNVLLEIRAGTGGEEAALFAGLLLRMYTRYAERKGYRYEILNAEETELGGIKEAEISFEGEGVFGRLKFESGVHRVQRVPETEAQGRIQTSAATVAVLPEAEEVDLEIDPKDLLIETHRSGGAGGQHVNKTESAIRIIHLPTGIEVDCQDERSQYKNKDKAMKILRSRLLEQKRSAQEAERGDLRRIQVGSGDRSERIRTYNFPQGRVTDHRIGLTLYKIQAMTDGDLDELIDALIAADTAKRMGEKNEEI